MQSDTETCSNCGYELTGLGSRGRCPECGQRFDYDTDEGIRQPATSADRSRLWLDKHLRTTTIGLIGGLMLIGIAAFILLAGITAPPAVALLAVLAGAWLLILLASYLDER